MNSIELYHHSIVEIWKSFCELHAKLYELTCDEYQLLLSSEIDNLEEKLEEKNAVINQIKSLEISRREVIQKINEKLKDDNKIKSVSDLISYMSNDESVEDSYKVYLKKYNALLIDIIEKIQEQNKTNQIFLNKALANLREIRDGFSGNKNPMITYGPQGKEIRGQRIR